MGGSFLQTVPKKCVPEHRICRLRCLNLNLVSTTSQNLARAGCHHALRTSFEAPGLSSLNVSILKGATSIAVLLNILDNRVNGD